MWCAFNFLFGEILFTGLTRTGSDRALKIDPAEHIWCTTTRSGASGTFLGCASSRVVPYICFTSLEDMIGYKKKSWAGFSLCLCKRLWLFVCFCWLWQKPPQKKMDRPHWKWMRKVAFWLQHQIWSGWYVKTIKYTRTWLPWNHLSVEKRITNIGGSSICRASKITLQKSIRTKTDRKTKLKKGRDRQTRRQIGSWFQLQWVYELAAVPLRDS